MQISKKKNHNSEPGIYKETLNRKEYGTRTTYKYSNRDIFHRELERQF